MPKRERTAKQLANDQRLSDEAAARRAQNVQAAPAEPQQTISYDEYQNLLNQINELKQAQWAPQPVQAPQAYRTTGTYEKYATNPELYPDPTDRLMEEPRLTKFAFKENYELVWKVETSRYQLADGTWEKQPKFTVHLIQKAFDDQGEPLTRVNTQGETVQVKYVLNNGVFHEDPDAAIQIAIEQGLPVDENTSKDFLDEMRFLRMRNWLLERFFPPKPTVRNGITEEVVNGQLIQIIETSTDGNKKAKIDFNSLDSKLRA